MFEQDIQNAILDFDTEVEKGFNHTTCEYILDSIKDNHQDLYTRLKKDYIDFKYPKSRYHIFKELHTLMKKNPYTTDIIYDFLGCLYLIDNNTKLALDYFTLAHDFQSCIYIYMNIFSFNKDKNIEYLHKALDTANTMLTDICKPKSKEDEELEFIDYSIFNLVINDCLDKNDFSRIVNLIDMMYFSFRKNDKYETFYYSLIKLADIKNVKLSFQPNKEFFSRENFQTVCYKMKELLSDNNSTQEKVVVSFEGILSKANKLKELKDYSNAETLYREAISTALTIKQKHTAFHKIFDMYENIDSARMLSILEEFDQEDVFENDFQKYYFQSKMIIKTKSSDYDAIENLKTLCKSLSTYEEVKKNSINRNALVIKCLELLKIYVLDMLNNEQFDNAHTGCKLAISLNKYNKKSNSKINEYMSFFLTKQTHCGKIKKDLAKKGNAKTSVPVMEKSTTTEENLKDPNDLLMFTFNNDYSNTLNYYENQINDANLNELNDFKSNTSGDENETINQLINSLIEPIKISTLIKSIYIQNDTFTGNPKQARLDMDFYINSTIRNNPLKKRDEYLSFVKIVRDTISKFGESIEYNITKNIMCEYIIKAITYNSQCYQDKEHKQYFLFIAELIKNNKVTINFFNESE